MKKIIFLLLSIFLLGSCSNGGNEQSPLTTQSQTQKIVQLDPLAIECPPGSPIGTYCGGGMVKGKHIIISPPGCDYGSSSDGGTQGTIIPDRKCGSEEDIKETWDFATKFCSEMTYKGFGKWRLPTQDEVTQVFVSKTEKMQSFLRQNSKKDTVTWWLSSLNNSAPDTAKTAELEFFSGKLYGGIDSKRSEEHSVRCVREF